MTNQKNIYAISPEDDFLRTLATYIFGLVKGDMFELASVKVILPNRRSSLKLKEDFMSLSPNSAVLLPQIFSLSEMDESQPEILGLIKQEEVLPVISPERRMMMLANIVRSNASQFGLAAINFDAALQLANSLATMLDDMEKHGLGISDLEKILPDELSKHRQISLEFIRFIFAEYPNMLAQLGVTDYARRTNQILDLYSASLRANGSGSYIFIAGSTGSIPATSRLIKAISETEKGYVILPYIDLKLNSFEWDAIEKTQVSHQLHLCRLLKFIDVKPHEVQVLPSGSTVRQNTISNLMRSSSSLQSWREDKTSNLDWLKLINARNPVHESKLISVIIKHKLGEGASVALITNNRDITDNVQLYLRRLGVDIDDSSGTTLANTREGRFFTQAAALISSGYNITILLSLLKDEFANLPKHQINLFEKNIIRKNNIKDISSLRGVVDDEAIQSSGLPRSLWSLAMTFGKTSTLRELVEQTYAIINIIAPEREQSENWQEIESLFNNFAADDHTVETSLYVDSVVTILSTRKTWPRYIPNRKLAILSPIEARLQHFDCVILGDLTLGSWPAGKFSPWFSRNMFRSMELPFEEAAISLSAHDFSTHLHHKQVYLTHSQYNSGEPLIESPFVSRVKAFYKAVTDTEIIPDETYHNYVETLDGNFTPRKTVPQPAPKIPAEARIKRLSVTKIETLLKNPYAIYASEVLKLRKLDELEKQPEAAEYGNFCHQVLEDFTLHHKLDVSKINKKDFNSIAQSVHEKLAKNNLSNPAWVTQVGQVGEWFIELEKDIAPALKQIIAEAKTELRVNDFTLVSKPDRIELTHDNLINIADYKTGRFANEKQVGRLTAPQMPLEAYMVKKGAFAGLSGQLNNIIYYNFSFSNKGPQKKIYSKLDLGELTNDVERELQNLIADLSNPEVPYLIRPNPKLKPDFDDYEHLERLES